MGFYACSLTPLVSSFQHLKKEMPKQVWYADDGAAGGTLIQLKDWWVHLCKEGPCFGYFPKPAKTVLVVKDGLEEEARKMFPGVTVSSVGHRYLGSYIGTDEGKENFIQEKIVEWEEDIKALSIIAATEPQAAYSAFMYGTSKRWLFVARTTPKVAEGFRRLDWLINETFVPAIVGKEYITDLMKDVFTLQAKQGGLGITNMSQTAELEYENSLIMTEQLTKLIYEQTDIMTLDQKKKEDALKEVDMKKTMYYDTKRARIYARMQTHEQRIIDLASEKGASSWLTSLPLADFGFVLNKQEFHDAILLRYNFKVKGVAATCTCGEQNSVNHALICKLGGYVALRHNSLRDTTAELLKSHGICKDVEVEPSLLPISGEVLPSGTVMGEEARLDVCARNLWSPLAKAFADIRVFHPQAQTNGTKSICAMYRSHELEKKRKYNSRVINVEKGTFTPLVFSTSGGMGMEATLFYKRIAERVANKTLQRYSDVVSFIRRRLRFDLLKTTLIALRGFRGTKPNSLSSPIGDLDINLME